MSEKLETWCPKCGQEEQVGGHGCAEKLAERLAWAQTKIVEAVNSSKEWEGRYMDQTVKLEKTLKLLEKGLDCGTGELWIEGHDDWDREQFLEAIKSILTGEKR